MRRNTDFVSSISWNWHGVKIGEYVWESTTYLIINADSIDLGEDAVAPLNLIMPMVRNTLILIHRCAGDTDERVGGTLRRSIVGNRINTVIVAAPEVLTLSGSRAYLCSGPPPSKK